MEKNMFDALLQLSLFTAKVVIIVVFILILLAGILALLSRGKQRSKISIKNLNSQYESTKKFLLSEILSKKSFKKFLKDEKLSEKKKVSSDSNDSKKNIFVLNFEG